MTETTTREVAAARVDAVGTAFPPGFVWGASTAAYQIEGGWDEDGRRPSMWDTFCHTPGKIRNGDVGDVATDHYHRSAEDVGILADLGVGAYRFSTSWARVVPDGSGPANQAGVDFYSRLVDQLLERNIRPVVTLYHWDLPQTLQDAGGWANRDTAQRFADYARVIGEALGDRVTAFTTLNEPWCSAFLGYASGVHAPGLRDNATALAAAHHLLLAHGCGVAALRSVLSESAELSVTLNLAVVRPASDSAADLTAARHVDGLANRIFLDPLLHGSYPADIIDDTGHISDWNFVHDGDMAVISAPLDVLGINYYSPTLVTAPSSQVAADVTRRWVNDPQGADGPSPWPGTDLAYALPQAGPYTSMGWRIEPDSLTELLVRVRRDYPPIPVLITENGAAFEDEVDASGRVPDPRRVEYLRGHLTAVHHAIRAGVDVRGYFVWSLLDNFEWAWGFSKRFGIVHVDFDTLQRRWKDSALWYREVIRANGLFG